MTVRELSRSEAARAPADFVRKAFYSPKEYAALAGVHPSTVLDLIHAGTLYAVRISERIYRIPLAVVLTTLFPGEKRQPKLIRLRGKAAARAVAAVERRWAREGLGEARIRRR